MSVAVRLEIRDSHGLERAFSALCREERRANRVTCLARPVDAALSLSNLAVWVYAAAQLCQNL
jgi:hypothetical protein